MLDRHVGCVKRRKQRIVVFVSEDVALPPGLSRETTIRRDAQGRWTHDGAPVTHEGLARAFDRWVDRAPDGRYCLRNAIHWVYVEIEGAPLFVRSVALDGDRVTLRLSDDREEPLAAHTLRIGPDGALYCDARGGTLAARFDRSAQLQLAPLVDEDGEGALLRIGSEVVRPDKTADPLRPVEFRDPAD